MAKKGWQHGIEKMLNYCKDSSIISKRTKEFVLSLQKQYEDKNYLSLKQVEVLKSIYCETKEEEKERKEEEHLISYYLT